MRNSCYSYRSVTCGSSDASAAVQGCCSGRTFQYACNVSSAMVHSLLITPEAGCQVASILCCISPAASERSNLVRVLCSSRLLTGRQDILAA